MRSLVVASLSFAVFFCIDGDVRAGLIGQTIKAEFIGGVDPGQHQFFTGVAPATFTFNFPVHAVNYGDLFTVSVNDSTITITDINHQAFIWEPGDKFVFAIQGGAHPIADASFVSSTFPGFGPSNVTFTGDTITLSTPPGGGLNFGDSLIIHVQTIPEPASMILWASITVGIGGVFFRTRGKRVPAAGRA